MNSFLTSVIGPLLAQELLGRYAHKNHARWSFAFFTLALLLGLTGVTFLVLAGYQGLSAHYPPVQARALTAATVLTLSALAALASAAFSRAARKRLFKAEEDLIRTLRDTAEGLAKDLEKPVQDNPKAAALAAVLIGILLGRRL